MRFFQRYMELQEGVGVRRERERGGGGGFFWLEGGWKRDHRML